MTLTEENGWTKNPDTSIYYKLVSLESPLAKRVLSDVEIRYPHFKPTYVYRYREYDGAPYDMLVAAVTGPEEVIINIMDDNGIPIHQNNHNDIASVTYMLAGDTLGFGQMYTFNDIATMNQPSIPPDLREFYEIYQQLKQTFPELVSLIEHFAAIYEKQLAWHNGTYEPLAIRELLWNFAKVLFRDVRGQNI
jgi:hypothetical protein